ncbi:MAG: hypothetical protein ACT4OP_01665 [Actinomycetota bacterium]
MGTEPRSPLPDQQSLFEHGADGDAPTNWERLSIDHPEYDDFRSSGNTPTPSQPIAGAAEPEPEAASEPTETTVLVENAEAEVASPVATERGASSYTGTLVSEDQVVAGELQLLADRVVLWGAGQVIGSWGHHQVRIARLTVSRFAIHAEGEALTFTADDATALDEALSVMERNRAVDDLTMERVHETAADEVIEAPKEESTLPGVSQVAETPAAAAITRRPRIKSFRKSPATQAPPPTEEPAVAPVELPSPENAQSPPEHGEEESSIAESVVAAATMHSKKARAKRWLPNDLRGIAIRLVVVLGFVLILSGIAYVLMLLMGSFGSEEPSATTATTAQEAVVTTTPSPITAPSTTTSTTAAVVETTLFATSLDEITDRWNLLAEDAAPELALFRPLTSPFLLVLTPDLTMEGIIDPVNGMVTMRGTPNGTPEVDGSILLALGLLIGTADPSLSGTERGALLGQLGLDVRQPQLAGLDGSLTYNGLAYRMIYRQDSGQLELTIVPG